MAKIDVKQKPGEEVPTEVIAEAIVEISKAMKKLSSTRLKRAAIVTLINDDTKLGKGLIETVILSLESLEQTYLKPEQK